MLIKKNVLNEINKDGTFTQGFKDFRKIKRKVSQNLEDLQNLLRKLTVKVSSAEKMWLSLLYEFLFSLNQVANQMIHMHERTYHHYIQ